MEKVECIVTQNVDNLHSKAGSKNLIELHGTAFKVICLNCNQKICRYKLQKIFEILNPFMTAATQTIRPDGDVELTQVCIIYIINISIYVSIHIYIYV